jgi:hypothetical protein
MCQYSPVLLGLRTRRLTSVATLAVTATALALVGAASSAGTASKTITGKLSKSGYTVIALGYNGKARSTRARSFKLKAPDGKVTLQVRNSKGKYAGPVVVGGGKQTVVMGVKAGAQLGLIKVLNGYAKPVKAPRAASIDKKRIARAKKGVPIGNGRNFGLVRSTARSTPGAGRDRDLDGVPDAFDIDINGDLVLNGIGNAGSSSAHPAGVSAVAPGSPFQSTLRLTVEETVNENASAVTTGDIDTALVNHLQVFKGIPEGDLVELDCGGLTYCSSGGTGEVPQGPPSPALPFPSCCDTDGNGFGTIRGSGAPPVFSGPLGDEFHLNPKATSAHIGSGDSIIERVTTGGTLTETPSTIPFVFTSVPALVSFTDGSGASGTLTYPAPTNGLGTHNNPIQLKKDPGGHYVLTGTFWRPQRKGVAGAGEADSIDIGGLLYSITAQVQGSMPVPGQSMQCPASSLSTTDPNLTIESEGGGSIGDFSDHASDVASSPANTFTGTVDLSGCLAAKGITLVLGNRITVGIEARAGSIGSLTAFASQDVTVTAG